jgi:hypothetical protein
LPEFDLEPFTAGPDEPVNPFLLKVMRRPLSAAERPIPVGVVSQTYSLASHREVVALCRDSLIDAGIEPVDLRYEVGLSELGEWMNFRVYFPDSYSFTDTHGNKLDLRLECFNSVDGSSRLMILFAWFRFICANGLVIGKTCFASLASWTCRFPPPRTPAKCARVLNREQGLAHDAPSSASRLRFRHRVRALFNRLRSRGHWPEQ